MTTATDEPPAAGPPGDTPVLTPRWRAAFAAPAVLALPWLALTAGSGLPPPLCSATGAVLALLVVTTTVTDLARQRIPNWATYTAVVWGFGLSLVAAAVPTDLTVSVPGVFAAGPQPLGAVLAGVPLGSAAAGFGVGFGIMLLLYSVFQGGAGDVKLVAAAGLLVGVERVVPAIVYGYVVAAVAGACWLVWVIGPVELFREVGRGLGLVKPAGAAVPKRKIPMAPFLNAGLLIALFWRA